MPWAMPPGDLAAEALRIDDGAHVVDGDVAEDLTWPVSGFTSTTGMWAPWPMIG